LLNGSDEAVRQAKDGLNGGGLQDWGADKNGIAADAEKGNALIANIGDMDEQEALQRRFVCEDTSKTTSCP
jgi:hypothetical protein